MTTTELPLPVAARLQRPRWRDPRLVVGVVLVCASVALGSVVVGRSDDRVAVYAARTALVPGQRLEEADLTRVEVQLGTEAARYLRVGRLALDRFVVAEVRSGELVPAAAVGGRDDAGVQPITLSVEAGSAATLVVGSQVDVYVNPPVATRDSGGDAGALPAGRGSTYSGPLLSLHAVSVAGLPRQEGALGGAASAQRYVQVMAPSEAIRGLIAQVDEGAKVTVVPVAGTVLESAK